MARPSACHFENGPQCVDRQLRRVPRSWRQAANGPNNVRLVYAAGIGNRFPLRQLGYRRRAGHGRNAALGAETNFGDAAGGNLDRQLQNVATGGILNPHLRGGVQHFAGIAGMLEVIKKFGRVHKRERRSYSIPPAEWLTTETQRKALLPRSTRLATSGTHKNDIPCSKEN